MLGAPHILILDEPTAGLDPKERVRFHNLISGFAKDRIVILSTHIVSDIEFIAEEIIMMKSGEILHFGKPQVITSEIDGLVWECAVPTECAERIAATFNTSNLLKQYRKVTYTNLLTSGRLNAYLVDIDRQAQECFDRLIEGMKQVQGITERLKEENIQCLVIDIYG